MDRLLESLSDFALERLLERDFERDLRASERERDLWLAERLRDLDFLERDFSGDLEWDFLLDLERDLRPDLERERFLLRDLDLKWIDTVR